MRSGVVEGMAAGVAARTGRLLPTRAARFVVVAAVLAMEPAPARAQIAPHAARPHDRANPVAEYLRGAELQADGAQQIATVRRALEDTVSLPRAVLRTRRYADYQGRPDAWDLPRLLERHFVPTGPRTLHDRFWDFVATPEVRRIVRAMLRAMPPPTDRAPRH